MTESVMSLLGGMTAQQFCAEYWQKKPLLIRNAFPEFICPISPDELAGLAMEEEVESRLIIEKDGDTPWQLKNGPFTSGVFSGLPDTNWTLLVQEINKHIPEFALMQDRFNFIPNWRMDDVMVSFAPEHGTVGPHADQYDVFLIQGLGRRRWQISSQVSGSDALLPDLPLRILRDFQSEQEWILEEGDMLYLPPGVVHHGVALEDCMTISMGFRAPNITETLAAYCADTVSGLDGEHFYHDPDMQVQSEPGLISQTALATLRKAMVAAISRDDKTMDDFLASYLTDVRPGHYLPEPDEPLDIEGLKTLIDAEGGLWRSEYARFSYIERDEQFILYVAGDSFPLDKDLSFIAPLLCRERYFDREDLLHYWDTPLIMVLLARLYNMGALYCPED